MTHLQIVFLSLATGLGLVWVLLAVFRPRPGESAGVVAVLRYGALLRTFALIAALAPLLIMSYFIARILTDANLAVAAFSFLATSAIAGLLLIESARTCVALTEESITKRSPWTGKVEIKWSEVESVRYSAANRWFVISGGGRTIRVSRHLNSIGAFAEIVRRKVASERWTSAAAIFDSLK